ncbi:MAG: type II toxin-antitoxin system VapC family toxin [Terrimicrobiaceae bacterium]
MKIALDTNAYSDWRRIGTWNDKISQATQVAMPVMVLGELRAGFLQGKHGGKNQAALLEFLAEPLVNVLNTTERTSQIYAEFRHSLKSRGTPIPENDIWIAALVHEHGLSLCTSDAHFSNLPQIARIGNPGF